MAFKELEILKRCSTCGEYKAISVHGVSTYKFFGKCKSNKDGHSGRCKRCSRSLMLQKKYGISLRQWNAMLRRQGGKCPICGKKQSEAKQTFHTDHNHRTGKVRAILCGYCNRRLMIYIHDNPKRAMGLARYLTKHFKDLEND